jgi:hypothetical protein
VLPKWNEQPIDLDPVLFGQMLLEDAASCFRRGRPDKSPPVSDPVNVDVDADLGGPAGNSEREIGALRPHTPKGSHYFEVARQIARELIGDTLCEISDILRLRFVETRGANQLCNFPDPETADFVSGRRCLEQSQRGGKRDFVSRAYGNDAGSQLVKRVSIPLFGKIEHRGVGKLLNFLPDAPNHGVDVEGAFCGAKTHTHLQPIVQGIVQLPVETRIVCCNFEVK